MLNIKQAKPGASGLEPLEPLSRALEEVLLFTGQGGGGGEEERGNAVCKISPTLPSRPGLGMGRVLGGGGCSAASPGSRGELRCRRAWGSFGLFQARQRQEHPQKADFSLRGGRNRPRPEVLES